MGASGAFSLREQGPMKAIQQGNLIRVSIGGTHSTGKTTLTENLAASLNKRGVKTLVAPEPIRILDDLHGQQSLTDRYLNLLRIHLQRLSQPDCQCCIYDRSLLDFCVYLQLEKMPLNRIYLLAQEMLVWYLPYFSEHIYLPVELDMIPDERRPKNESYRRDIDNEFIRIADEFGVQLQTVTGSVEERTRQSLQLVEAALAEQK
jgi:nicotinamide riboside kinase